MGKKKNKKEFSASNTPNTSNRESFFGDHASSNDSSFIDYGKTTNLFKILLCESIEDKDKYFKWTKNCSWKNIAFVNPLILQEYSIGSYMLIKGIFSSSIFITYPLKTVKQSTILLLEGLRHRNEDVVKIFALHGEGYEAQEIIISLPEVEVCENIKEVLHRHLCNLFIWAGLKVELEYMATKYEFIIKDVISTGQVLHKNFKNKIEEFSCCDISYTSEHNDTPISRRENSVNKNVTTLSKGMSSLTLENSEDISEPSITNFYVLSYRTIIRYCCGSLNMEESISLNEHIGGYHKQIKFIDEYIDKFLRMANIKAFKCHLLLLTGSLETEKNVLLKAIYNKYKHFTQEINKVDLVNKNLPEVLIELKNKLKPMKRKPSILLIKELDHIFPPKKPSIYYNISQSLESLIINCDPKILLVASAKESAYENILPNNFIIQNIKFSLPSTEERLEIIEKLLDGMKHDLTAKEMKQCADLTEGMNGDEIFKVLKYTSTLLSTIKVKNTCSRKTNFDDKVVSFYDVKKAVKMKKSHIMSSGLKPNKVSWNDIGGMDSVKEKLKNEIELFRLSSEIKKKFNYTPSRGMLLYGPPGCSKTMIAKALAFECNWNFISKKSSELLNMYVGESEKAITKLFSEARARAPCIIFLDEIDALAADRSSSSNSSGVGNRIVSTLLTELDGFDTLSDVMVVAATNRPDIIDPALMRPGRIGQHIYVPLPDSETRKEILKLSMKRRCVHEKVDFDILVDRTKGYTGAEIVHVCNEAAMQLLLEGLDCESPIFKMYHFEKALLAVPPRTSKELIESYVQFHSNKS